MLRPKPLTIVTLAVVAAVGFILLRMVYRIAFGGAAAGANVVWDFPRLRLSGPFSHIVLLGPVTLEGLQSAAVSALPFAAVIVVTGVAVSVVDPRSWVFVIPRIRWGRATFVAFLIALATLPALVETARRTHDAARMRGVSKRRALFVPFLDKTLERAVGIAKAIQARGLVLRDTAVIRSDSSHVLLEEFCLPSRGVPPISWDVPPSSLVLLTGETGSGKTSLLEALAGVLDSPTTVHTSGSLAAPNEVAYLPHEPKTLFLAGRVVDEVALGLVMAGVSTPEARDRATEQLALWGLAHLADNHPVEISEGESVLVAMISALVLRPRLLLLDEPLAVLDATRRGQVVDALADFVESSGAIVLMTDHGHVSATRWPGDIVQLGPEGIVAGTFTPPKPTSPPRVDVPRPDADVVLEVVDLIARRGDTVVVEGGDLTIRRGESLVIVGDNGVGKTTVLESLIRHGGYDPSRCAYVPVNPGDLFVCESLANELAFADRELSLPDGFTRATLDSLLPGGWRGNIVDGLQSTHPRDLSRGQQTALAIALQMSHKPSVLVLDEPTRGLDSGARDALREVLACVQETGTAIVSASHDVDYVSGGHDRVFVVAAGVLAEVQQGRVNV